MYPQSSHPTHVLACGRGVEALLLAMLDGHHALDKVGARLEARGMLPWLQEGLGRASLHDDRLGQLLDLSTYARLVPGEAGGAHHPGAAYLC